LRGAVGGHHVHCTSHRKGTTCLTSPSST